MNKNEGSKIRDRFTDGGDFAVEPETQVALQAVGWFAAILVVAIACGVLLASCGSERSSSTEASAQASTPESGVQAAVASAVPAPAPAQGGLSASDVAIREGLPPDLSVSVGDTLVQPGQAVEFVVQGTSDVTQVALSDGRDEPTPLVRDEGSDTWRAQYRVPLHPRHERFGISVTAKTEASRWRRVWVFLHVGASDSTRVEPAIEDSTGDDR